MKMRMRRVRLLQEMFEDICNPSELKQVDQLYTKGYKSSAIVFMLRKVKAQWDQVINGDDRQRAMSGSHGNASRQVIKITCATCQGQTAYLQI